MLFDVVYAINQDSIVVCDFEHRALFALILTGEHDNSITFFNFAHFFTPNRQITSGAREMIFINFSDRSSRVTGPKIRVPSG